MDDQIPYYLKRKNELDKLRRKENSSELKKRTIDVLASDLVINLSQDKHEIEDNSTFEERFENYIRSIDNERFERKSDRP